MRIGLMGAMPEEMNKIIDAMEVVKVEERGSRSYYVGRLYGKDVVAVFSRWGKVAAATTAVHLILEYKVDSIVFTGVAGGILPNMHVGDVVVGNQFFQHDMDARPLMRQFEIPLTGKISFDVPTERTETMRHAVNQLLHEDLDFSQMLSENGVMHPKVFVGGIASADMFVSSQAKCDEIRMLLPSVHCVEMEGAAVAQVCEDYQIPLQLVRVISDSANEDSPTTSIAFVNRHAADYSLGIIRAFFALI